MSSTVVCPNQVKCVSKVFAHVNKERHESYSNYENFAISWSSPDYYQLVRRIGRGKYSDVFVGVDVRTDTEIVVKVLKPVRKRKIGREIKILENIRGHPNIVTLTDVTKSERGIPSLIFEYISCPEYSKFSSLLTLQDIQFYMLELAKALQFAHSNGIIHRDVKPQNVIVNFSKRILKLIDWGLAEFYFPGMPYHVRVASRYYKSPELLIDYQYYDYSLDIWSYGCVLGGMIFQKEPFFQGLDNRDQLFKILAVLGSKDLMEYYAKLNLTPGRDLVGHIENFDSVPFECFIDTENNHVSDPCAINLLKKCLVIDHTQRITAEEVIAHEFFSLNFNTSNSLCNRLR